jgi:signal transduction histidine kinase
LTICRNIVERHGGVIGVRAGEGDVGNCFFFTLPDA